ncbi:MAG: amidohydrolase family protein, partial [Planctomycetota bacterium]
MRTIHRSGGVWAASLLLLPFLCFLAFQEKETRSVNDFDVLIRGGTVYDGSGGPGRRADVAITGDRVVRVGTLAERRAERVIDARGKLVCPGFIDLHSHSDSRILKKRLRANLSYLTQGCTTIVTGNCGSGKVDVAAYFAKLDEQGAGTNVAHLIPHGAVRELAMGGSFNRPPSKQELAKMKELVGAGMKAGAFGMSTGLIYTPGSFATIDEIVELAKVVHEHGGIYASHIRSEADALLEAVGEAIEIGRRSGARVHISHFKASLPANWGRVKDSCALVEKAREEGLHVTCDQYPYSASSTSIAALVIPTWAREGRNEDLLRRFDDPETGPKVRGEIAKAFERRGGAGKILIARFKKDESANGKTVLAFARQAGVDPVEAVVRIQRGGGASAVAFSMSDADVEYVMRKPYVATASDGSSRLPDEERPHPRSYGTFPRKIGRYAIERGHIEVSVAVRSATGLPADILGLRDRGYLRAGYRADLVVLDPGEFRDRATYEEPHRFSTGVEWLFVNGEAVIAGGRRTEALPGRSLRHASEADSARD